MGSINQTVITEWCKDTALNSSATKWQVTWEFLRFIMKPIIGFLVGFFVGFYSVIILGALFRAGRGKKAGMVLFIVASIVGILSGFGGLAISAYWTMNP